jgi:hypothetical protein
MLDSWYYGRWTSTAFNFLKFNVLSGQSAYFGTSSNLTYIITYPLSQYPALYPFLIIGIYSYIKTHSYERTFPLIGSVFVTYLCILTKIGHKESRFMLPLYSSICMFIAFGIKETHSCVARFSHGRKMHKLLSVILTKFIL